MLEQDIKHWLAEDIGDGDHTTLCCIPADAIGRSRLIVKDTGIIAGIEVAKKVFEIFDKELRVKLLEGTRTRILDTRKTTPGLRMLEKEAVLIGGGCNHRIGLYDMILLKDNHIDFAGGISQAIDRANKYLKDNNKKLKIEIEVRNFDELNEVLASGNVNRIMLDNFSVADTRKAVEIIGGRFETESSGGITETTIREYALAGVDYISVGVLTHSIKSLDMSFKAIK